MKIITVNLPQCHIQKIKGLIGDEGLYPSRSELIRVAVRDFLIKELKIAKNFPKGNLFHPNSENVVISSEEKDTGTIQVPIDIKVGDAIIRDFKHYKIVTREEVLAKREAKSNGSPYAQ